MFAEARSGGIFSWLLPEKRPKPTPSRLPRAIPRQAVVAFLASKPIDCRSYRHFAAFCIDQGESPPNEQTFRFNLDQLVGPEPNPQRSATDLPPARQRRRTDLEPTPPRPERPRLLEFPADAHARQLRERVLMRDEESLGLLRTPEIQEIYREMCAELGWRPRPWNPVAHRFTQITTGCKVYDNVLLEDGHIHKLRVYPVSTPERAPDASTRQRDVASTALELEAA